MPSLTMQVSPVAPGARLPALDELKGFAILLVILYHAGGVLTWQNLLKGDLGVDIFVILSGVGLALGDDPKLGAAAFLRRRVWRILPTYWVALTLFAALNPVLLGVRYSAPDVALHYTGLHAWFGDAYAMSINDSFWFITLILSLYLLYLPIRREASPERILLWGAGLSVAITMVFFFRGQAAVFGHLCLRLPGFFVGLLIGRLLRTGRLELGLGPALLGALLLGIYLPYMRGVMFHTVVVGLVVAGAFLYLLRPALGRWAGERPAVALRFLGRHSLEIFLLHQPLMRDYNVFVQTRWLGIARPEAPELIFGMVVGLGIALVLSVELRRLMQRLLPA